MIKYLLTDYILHGIILSVNKAEATASHLLIRSDGFDIVMICKGWHYVALYFLKNNAGGVFY